VLHLLARDLIEDFLQRRAVFIEHLDELDAVAELRVASDYPGGDEKRFRSIEFKFLDACLRGMDTCSRCSIRRGLSPMLRNAEERCYFRSESQRER